MSGLGYVIGGLFAFMSVATWSAGLFSLDRENIQAQARFSASIASAALAALCFWMLP